MAFQKERIYSIDDIYALPDGERAELIDGRLYMMAPPPIPHPPKTCQSSFPKDHKLYRFKTRPL